MSKLKKNNEQANLGIQVGVDPVRTPILYADAIQVNSNENGFVINVAQTVTGTNQALVVARFGLSKEHAEKLAKAIAEQVTKVGILTTNHKAEILN